MDNQDLDDNLVANESCEIGSMPKNVFELDATVLMPL